MFYISIDAGASGAVAVFNDLKLLGVADVPFVTIGKNKIMDQKSLDSFVVSIIGDARIEQVFIEQVSSRTGQGVKSMFSFGSRFGEVCTWALTFTENIVFLTPQRWKSSSGLIGTDKKESAIRAANIYPALEERFVQPNKRCKDGFKYFDGRGDAVIIGLMGYKGENK